MSAVSPSATLLKLKSTPPTRAGTYKDWQTAMAEKKKAFKRKMEADREAAGYIKAAHHREAKRRRR